MPDTALSQRQFLWLAFVVGLVALILREQFIFAAILENPIRGDVRDYVRYAWNLLNHGVFSLSPPSLAPPAPDSFRSPGYPLIITASMLASSSPEGWYALMLHFQAVIGSLTAVLTVALSRHWMGRGASLLAGGLVAVQPHHIVATNALLLEVTLAFVLVLALLAAVRAMATHRIGWAIAAGFLFGYAALINLVMLLFPLIVLGVYVVIRQWRIGAVICVLALALPGAWSVRNASLPDSAEPGRAAINLVQGSWPNYHDAMSHRFINESARQFLEALNQEARHLQSQPFSGLSGIAKRIADHPGAYLKWYLLEKPWLLWDWDIRVGVGGIYFHRLENSPFERHGLLRGLVTVQKAANPLIFWLALSATLIASIQAIRARRLERASSILLVAAFFVYVTVIHAVFQAEPRFAIAYRPLQLILAVWCLGWMVQRARVFWQRRSRHD